MKKINAAGTSHKATNREGIRSHQTSKKKNHDAPIGKPLFLTNTLQKNTFSCLENVGTARLYVS